MMTKHFISLSLCGLALTAPIARAEIDSQQFEQAFTKFAQTPKGQETIAKAVEEFFKKRQEEARKQEEDRAAADIEEQFKNPVVIPVGNSPVKGPADAKITIIEFSDFQCPFCKRGKDTAEAVLKAYPNDVKLVFKNLPLPFHNEALPSAKAALAAHKQGKFWEMHDALFDNQGSLGTELYEQKAKELGLDLAKFKADMASEEFDKQIKEEAALANKHGIQGTPGFFVGGVAVKGAYPLDHFKKIIDRHLAKK